MKYLPSIVGASVAIGAVVSVALAQSTQFTHTVTGQPLDLELAQEEGGDTEAVQHFLETSENPYNEDEEILPSAEEHYLSACSGCHGHYGEGKLGPGLNDDYWTYPRNETDVGLFSTIFGGAQGMMGPMHLQLSLDEMLQVMAWVRHLYTGEASTATWLTEEQRKNFTPYEK